MSFRGAGSSALSQMLKEGSRHYQGVDEALFRSIEACVELARSVASAYGPNGLNKMVINHLEKLSVTSDAATILNQLEVQHPAAKLLVMASQMQEAEVGDGTNAVVLFAAALLENAEELVRSGLTPVQVAEGYQLALKKALDLLPELRVDEVQDMHKPDQAIKAVRTAMSSKPLAGADYLAKLVAEACQAVLPESGALNVDNVRVCKVLGSGLDQSQVVLGMVFKRQVEGDITKARDAKVAVYTCAVDTLQTETKGTVLIQSAQELRNFSRGEENMLEAQIKAIADAGVKVVVSGGKVGDMALHYLNKYCLMAVRLLSKFDVRRVCRVVGATALPKLTAPRPEDLGLCDSVYLDELGDTPVVVFRQEGRQTRVATVLLRGSTDSLLDDAERAVDDGVNAFKAATKDGRLVPGAGAVEAELAQRLATWADTLPGLEQYAAHKFAQALESLVRTLAQNSGASKPEELVAQIQAAHNQGDPNACLKDEGLGDAVKNGLLDLLITKHWSLQYATNAASTVLHVDQIIMAKPAGGPKGKPERGDWDDDK
ncbi:T-complex protein 1 subunit theta [Dermacentor andersoni]|uniref:T-complex protein 1 subunit theta n=1 Tax=Dermacentor andersoni TaxID=34620 RepID=UPI003B3B5063